MTPSDPTSATRHAPAEGVALTIVGIDTGLQRTGYAFIAEKTGGDELRLLEAGVIRLDPRAPLERRLAELADNLEQLLEAHQPAALACEALYSHYKHPRTAILMGHARGVVLALAGRRAMEVVNVPATQAKKIITGNGRAGKQQIQRAIAATLRLGRLPEPHDVADALAVALAGLRMRAAVEYVARDAAGVRS